jgi:hypothetical protein
MRPVTTDQAVSRAAKSRLAQGLPPAISDPRILDRVAAVLSRGQSPPTRERGPAGPRPVAVVTSPSSDTQLYPGTAA